MNRATLQTYCEEHNRSKLLNEWHPTRNGSLRPEDVPPRTARKVWWVCEKGHEWMATIASRSGDGAGCPVCNGKVIVPGFNDLASAFPEIAAQWHPELNGDLTAQAVAPYSNRKVWWQCEKGHAYATNISHRTQRASGCPYCIGRKVLPGFNDLATLEPELAKEWHPELNGALTPDQVTTGSSKSVWWQCRSGHTWKAIIFSRARRNRCGCPVCSGRSREEAAK